MSRKLSEKAVHVLSLIAEGHSSTQIVEGDHGLTSTDIFAAANEALALSTDEPQDSLARIRRVHPRAYEPWDEEEDAELLSMLDDGRLPAEIAKHLGRKRSAIHSRIRKLAGDVRSRPNRGRDPVASSASGRTGA